MIRCRYLFICLVLLMTTLRSKGDDGDWQQWTELSWTQKIAQGIDVGFRFESRWEEDISRFAYYEIEPMIAWRYSPRWDFGLGYERDERFQPKEEISHVPNLEATLKVPRQPWKLIPILDWRLSNRFRVDFTLPEDEKVDWQPIYRNRTKWETHWRWGSKELVPFVFEEWFLNLDRGNFTQNRVGIGLGIPIVPHWVARLYWMRFDEKTPQGWEWHPVLGFQLQTQF